MADENFILPKTERSVSRIISGITRFFEISSLCYGGVYTGYTVCRIIFMRNYLVQNIFLCAFSCILYGFSLFEFIRGTSVNRFLKFYVGIARRLVCVAITFAVFISLFKVYDTLMPWRILFALFCGTGLIMSCIGDVFNATVPGWTEEILGSFKSDIEISGLASRSLVQIKDAVAGNDELKKKSAEAIAVATGGAVLFNFIKKLLRKRKS